MYRMTSRATWARIPRWAFAVGDQGIVAVTNLSLTIVVAHVGGVATLGQFALISTAILVVLGFARLLLSDPWLASRSAPRTPEPELRWLLCVAAVAALVGVLGVSVLISKGDPVWTIGGLVGAAVVIQDFGRYAAFRKEQAHRALWSDLTVLGAGAVVLVVTGLALGAVTIAALLAAWTTGLVAGAAVNARLVWGAVTRTRSKAWWREYCRPLAMKLGFDTAAYLVGVNGSIYLLAYFASRSTVGEVRIVQTMFSPAALAVTGLTMWLVPHLANRSAGSAARARARATVWLVAWTLPLVTVAVIVGPWLAELIFGITDPPGYLPLALAAVSTLATALAAPWLASARVTGHYLPVAWSRAGAAALTIIGMLTLVALRTTSGYLGLLAFQNAAVAVAAIAVGVRSKAAMPERVTAAP